VKSTGRSRTGRSAVHRGGGGLSSTFRVDAHTAGAEVGTRTSPKRLEVEHRLVHRFSEMVGMSGGPGRKRLDRGVRDVALEQTEDRLALGVTRSPCSREDGVRVVRALHDRSTLTTIIVDKQVARERAILRRAPHRAMLAMRPGSRPDTVR